jgi:hypothetical protein
MVRVHKGTFPMTFLHTVSNESAPGVSANILTMQGLSKASPGEIDRIFEFEKILLALCTFDVLTILPTLHCCCFIFAVLPKEIHQ